MKKYFYIVAASALSLSCAGLTSCSSSTGGENGGDGPTPSGEITSLTLEADKLTVEADGKDAVTFTIYDQNRNVVTTTRSMHIQDMTTNVFVEPVATFGEDGVFPFRARYGSKIYSNTVNITAQNHNKYEKYFRRVGLYRLTDVKCINCPQMETTIENVEKEMPDRIVHMAFHGRYSQVDPFEIPATSTLWNMFKVRGVPTAIIDLYNSTVDGGGSDMNALILLAKESMKENFATCGIKISSEVDADSSMATVRPEVSFDKDGNYSVGYALVTDQLGGPQEGVTGTYMHNNVVRAISGNNVLGGTIGEQKAGTTWAPEEPFSIQVADKNAIQNSRVVVYVLRENAKGQWHINNIAQCALDGGSVDYKLNE